MSVTEAGPLNHALSVLEISTGYAGAYAGWLLAGMGAAVRRLDLPSGPEASGGLERGLSWLNAGKSTVRDPSDAGLTAPGETDIVITDDPRRLESLAGKPLEAIARERGRGVVAVATVFGLNGPLAGIPASGLDAQAISASAWVLGEPGRAPLTLPPGLAEAQAGTHLAAAALLALKAGATEGAARIVDIALADVLASYVGTNCRYLVHHGLRWQRSGRRASDSGGAYPFVILRCRDGDVCLSGRTRDEWDRFVAVMGNPAWTREPRYRSLREIGLNYPEEVDALVEPWLLQHTKAEIADLANRHRLTIAPLRDLAEVLETPQFHERGFLRKAHIDGHDRLMPGLPYRITARRDPGSPDLAPTLLSSVASDRPAAPADRARPLAGLRVLDLGWVWSAPQVGGILAQLGAEVIKVEHAGRPDNTRLSGRVLRDGVKVEGPTTEMAPMFHQINRGKLGITLNLKEPEAGALLRRLVRESDVVIENMAAGALERSGLGYAALSAENPRLVMLSMTGAGQFGPLADMRTYAPVMSSFVGLESLVGYPGEPPQGALNLALGDPNAAAHGLVALMAALVARDAIGRGCYIDLSQTEALLATMAPYLLLAQETGTQPPLLGNAHPGMVPHGVFPAAGRDRWLTLAVADDGQWRALAALVGRTDWARGDWASAAGRIAGRGALEAALAEWTATQERDALVKALRGAGIAAAPVLDLKEMWTDPQFSARGVKHPVAIPWLGEEELFAPPWRFSDLAPPPAPCGPTLGQHNQQVLGGLLGLDEAEIEALAARGIVA